MQYSVPLVCICNEFSTLCLYVYSTRYLSSVCRTLLLFCVPFSVLLSCVVLCLNSVCSSLCFYSVCSSLCPLLSTHFFYAVPISPHLMPPMSSVQFLAQLLCLTFSISTLQKPGSLSQIRSRRRALTPDSRSSPSKVRPQVLFTRA